MIKYAAKTMNCQEFFDQMIEQAKRRHVLSNGIILSAEESRTAITSEPRDIKWRDERYLGNVCYQIFTYQGGVLVRRFSSLGSLKSWRFRSLTKAFSAIPTNAKTCRQKLESSYGGRGIRGSEWGRK